MKPDSISKEIQNYIADVKRISESTTGLDFDGCQRILEHAAETKSDALFGIGYYCFAEYYWDKKDAEQTMRCLGECMKYFCDAELQKYLPRVYNMMGVVADSTDNRLMALSYYYTCLQYANLYQDAYIHGMANYNIAYILIRMKHYADAKEHYYSAIEYLEKSEETIPQRRNLIQCMVYCGFCHLMLNEWQEALALMDRIQDARKKASEGEYPRLSLLAFAAACEKVKENHALSIQLADQLQEAFERDENPKEMQEMVVILADLMVKMKSYKRMERLIDLLDEKRIEKNAAVYLDLYPFKSRYLLNNNRVEEYVEYTKRYLTLYSKRQQDSKAVMARILELQERLSREEMERKDILAYNRKLESIALYDSLTGLANRNYLNEYLSQRFEEACANQTLIGVELMDIDFFKEYNDTYGHLAGDTCIKAVAEVLKDVENESVFCARYGGDEFMLVYSGMTAHEIHDVAETIQKGVRMLNIPHVGSECENKVTVSQGIFVKVPEEQNREWDYNSMADTVLYEAKRQGRNRYHIATDFTE